MNMYSAKFYFWVNYSCNHTLYLLGEVAYHWKSYTVLDITEIVLPTLEVLLLLVYYPTLHLSFVVYVCSCLRAASAGAAKHQSSS